MLTLTLLILVLPLSTSAQDFDIWDFIAHPRQPTYNFTYPTTRSIFIANAGKHLPVLVWEETTKYFPLVSVKLALLAHYPNANAATQALLSEAIPAGDTAMNEIRYLAAFKEEIRRTYPTLPPQIPAWSDAEIASDHNGLQGANWSYVGFTNGKVQNWMLTNHQRAKKIAERMTYFDTQNMTNLARNTELIRDSARVSLAEIGGFTLTAGAHNLRFYTKTSGVPQTYTAGSSVDMNYVHRLTTIEDTTGTATIASKGAPLRVYIGTGSVIKVAKLGTRAFTDAELQQGVKITTLAPPVATRTLSDITLEQGGVQSVYLEGLFTGAEFTTAVTTSDSNKATATKSHSGGSIGIRGIAVGEATVNVSATNEAGTTTVSFNVTVTESTD